MAKKAQVEVNKSQAIRDALKEYPDKPPKWIAQTLTEKGIPVSAQYVSVIKSADKGKQRSVQVPKLRTAGVVDSLTAAVNFIRATGGLAAAKRALAAVEEIRTLG
jgi:hypothetical protein